MYSRILLKLSGEQLAGSNEYGFDTHFATWLAKEIKPVTTSGTQVVIMVGGGNIVRGASIAGDKIKRVTADHMGMLATMINAIALTDVFEEINLPTRCLSNIYAEQVAEPFVYRLAEKHLANGRVVIIGGGNGTPYVTTDTAAILMALELDCQVVLKATKVNGVYDQDPSLYTKAQKLDHISYQKAVEDGFIRVMDKAALGLAMDYRMPIIVFNCLEQGNIMRCVKGEKVGTTIG